MKQGLCLRGISTGSYFGRPRRSRAGSSPETPVSLRKSPAGGLALPRRCCSSLSVLHGRRAAVTSELRAQQRSGEGGSLAAGSNPTEGPACPEDPQAAAGKLSATPRASASAASRRRVRRDRLAVCSSAFGDVAGSSGAVPYMGAGVGAAAAAHAAAPSRGGCLTAFRKRNCSFLADF